MGTEALPRHEPVGFDFSALFALYPFIDDCGSSVPDFEKLKAFFEEPRFITTYCGPGIVNQRLTVDLISLTSSHKGLLGKKFIVQYCNWALKISGHCSYCAADIGLKDSDDGAYSHREFERWRKHELPIALYADIQTFLCGISIACPTATHVVKSLWSINDEPTDRNLHLYSLVSEAADFLESNGVPLIDVETSEAVRWTQQQNGMLKGYSDTPASKSLSFFTRLFVESWRNDELSDLVWAVAGIEALLVDGGRSSIGQLKVKLEVLFQGYDKSKWILEMMEKTYSYRSKMLHGNRNLRSAFRHEEDQPSRFKEESESQLFAIGLLLWLIRYVIKNDLSSIKFRTILE